jgi:hypothetical protein
MTYGPGPLRTVYGEAKTPTHATVPLNERWIWSGQPKVYNFRPKTVR